MLMEHEDTIRDALAREFSSRARKLYNNGVGQQAKRDIREHIEKVLPEIVQRMSVVQSNPVDPIIADLIGQNLVSSYVSSYNTSNVVADTEKYWRQSAEEYLDHYANSLNGVLSSNQVAREKEAEELGEFFEPLIQYAAKRDQVVKNLNAQAESKPIEEVIQPENLNKAVRVMFPTAEDYLDSMLTALALSEKVVENMILRAKQPRQSFERRAMLTAMQKHREIYTSTVLKADVEALYG